MDTLRFGRSMRALRRRMSVSQAEAGRRIGVSASTVSRIEAGRIGRVGFATLHALGALFGADVQLAVRWRGEGLDRLLDEAHSALVDATLQILQAGGWIVAVEASFSVAGERGSVDVLGWHPNSACVVVIEVKSVVPDNQATLFGLDRKARLAPILARERGWTCGAVARILVIGEGRTSRRRVESHAAMFAAALPVRGRAVLSWLRRPSRPAPAGILFLDGGRGHAARVPRGVRRNSSNVRRVHARQRVTADDGNGHA